MDAALMFIIKYHHSCLSAWRSIKKKCVRDKFKAVFIELCKGDN